MTRLRLATPASEATWSNIATVETDAYGIARYLADAVLSGVVTLAAAADALGDWADRDAQVLDRLASGLPPGNSARHLALVASTHDAP